ncbi:MAG: GGDEF domain-containing protein [bacterium]|nr:GGDEF domain-containing protein [bacterium]
MRFKLNEIELFSDFSDDDVPILADFFRPLTLISNEKPRREPGRNRELFIILSGRVERTIAFKSGSERKKKKLGPGDFTGVLSLFSAEECYESFHAIERTQLLSIDEPSLTRLIDQYPHIAGKFFLKLLTLTIQGLRDSNRFLADMVQWGDKARKRTITDELTGVYNRRFLDDALPGHFATAKKGGYPLCFLMIDLDNFRDINEVNGMEAGNSILKDVVVQFQQLFREKDIIVRYGGDEFTIILPETTLKEAWEIAERVREAVENRDMSKLLEDYTHKLTTSIGLSAFPETASTLDELKDQADSSLYAAKEKGRNMVITAEQLNE